MRSSRLGMLAAVGVLAGAVFCTAPSAAATREAAPGETARAAWDVSAAKQKARKQRKARRAPHPAYAAEPVRPRWRGPDPSFDLDGRPYRSPFPYKCMRDLGYGRWESCDVDM